MTLRLPVAGGVFWCTLLELAGQPVVVALLVVAEVSGEAGAAVLACLTVLWQVPRWCILLELAGWLNCLRACCVVVVMQWCQVASAARLVLQAGALHECLRELGMAACAAAVSLQSCLMHCVWGIDSSRLIQTACKLDESTGVLCQHRLESTQMMWLL